MFWMRMVEQNDPDIIMLKDFIGPFITTQDPKGKTK